VSHITAVELLTKIDEMQHRKIKRTDFDANLDVLYHNIDSLLHN